MSLAGGLMFGEREGCGWEGAHIYPSLDEERGYSWINCHNFEPRFIVRRVVEDGWCFV